MGSDTSRFKGLEINEKAIEITDFWGHYRATIHDSASFFNLKGYGSISVFKSDSTKANSLRPLDKCSNNLMKYRHPHIVRYLWHWQSRGTSYLATEPVQPLSQVLSSQDSLQICVGLHQVVQALDFLHGKAAQSHNNISVSSIYVMPDGSWRLGGMEFLKPFSEMTLSYLKQIKTHRYDSAVDPDEESSDSFAKVDQYAFCILVEDAFKGRNDDDVPHLKKFKQYCKMELQNSTASLRPSFATLLRHDFFNHQFISVHKFLSSLPIKSESEKKNFFSSLLNELSEFNEETVARQLGGSLLSRLVLLNTTAREKLLPYVLTPKDNKSPSNRGLFTLSVFKHHITPQLLRMFRVRDTQVRLLLLKYFSDYMGTFTEQELTAHILPELLLGIKDTDDTLVSMTLYCLADLIPILGASTVIGAKRSKIFTDGRPMIHSKLDDSLVPDIRRKKLTNVDAVNQNRRNEIVGVFVDKDKRADSQNAVVESISRDVSFGSRESMEIGNNPCLHERPSPDGGEDLNDEIVQNVDDSDDNWSDWEDENRHAPKVREESVDPKEYSESFENIKPIEIETSKETEGLDNGGYKQNDRSFLQDAAFAAKSKKIADISELDIKNQKSNSTNGVGSNKKEEFDFFTDMVPVIEKASTLLILESLNSKSVKSSLAVDESGVAGTGGSTWGDVDWDED